jgi:hypothetical protein
MTSKLPKIRKTYSFHKNMNSKIWDIKTNEMHLDVRVKLLKEALLFYNFLGVKDLKINDIIVAGSNAGYNYTAKSDLDIHIVIDFSQVADADLLKNLCDTKRFLWSFYYSIKLHGIPTEMYVEDASQPVDSNGIYSILFGKWLKFPKKDNPDYQDSEILKKVTSYKNDIEWVLEFPSVEHIDHLLNRIHSLRTDGLEKAGEYSTENVAYKVIRALGYIDKLIDLKNKLIDKEYSLT